MGARHNHHEVAFDGMSSTYRRTLWFVIAINGAMFVVEMFFGRLSDSQALQADALDFLGDFATYSLSLAVIGSSLRTRANAALVKGFSLLLAGLWVAGNTAYKMLFDASVLLNQIASSVAGPASVPDSYTMGGVAMLALIANLVSVLLLMRFKDGDANVRSVWLCSRNDAIGNVAVMIAALGVWGSSTAWPDLVVAMMMASLFLHSAILIIGQALRERRR